MPSVSSPSLGDGGAGGHAAYRDGNRGNAHRRFGTGCPEPAKKSFWLLSPLAPRLISPPRHSLAAGDFSDVFGGSLTEKRSLYRDGGIANQHPQATRVVPARNALLITPRASQSLSSMFPLASTISATPPYSPVQVLSKVLHQA